MNNKVFISAFLAVVLSISSAYARNRVGNVKCVEQNQKEYCTDETGKPIRGRVIIAGKNGNISSIGYFRNGYRSGYSRFYDGNGIIMRSTGYNKGIKNGSERLYHPGGKTWIRSEYKKGVLDGKIRMNNKDGKRVGELVFSNGLFAKGYCIGADKKKKNLSFGQVNQQSLEHIAIICEKQ